MKYLFFDIECSNCDYGVGKMCEFGYVLTDENLTILQEDDIPMSPGRGKENAFKLKGREHEKDLELAYDEEYYFSCHEFPHFYERIRRLIEDPETLCFAFSMNNDISHLYNSCKRYRKNEYNYTCFDIQKLACKYLDKNTQVSLKEACKRIVGRNSTIKLQEHLSRDDAKMEMMVFEAVCTLENKKPRDLLNEMDYAKTNSIEHMKTVREKLLKRQAVKNSKAYYKAHCDNDETLNNQDNIGKRFLLSSKLVLAHDKMKEAIKIIKENGGYVSQTIAQSDYFVAFDEENISKILLGLREPYNGKFITYNDLINKTNY